MSCLPEMLRQEQARAAPGIEIPCHDCGKPVPMPLDGTAFYWTPRGYEQRPAHCAKCAVTAEAPMIKPQPSRREIPGCEGWDL